MRKKKMSIRKIKPKSFDGEMIGGKSEKVKVYPKIRFSLKDLPEAKDWEVGKEYFLKLFVKQVGLHMENDFQEVVFEVRAVDADQGSKNPPKKKVRRYA